MASVDSKDTPIKTTKNSKDTKDTKETTHDNPKTVHDQTITNHQWEVLKIRFTNTLHGFNTLTDDHSLILGLARWMHTEHNSYLGYPIEKQPSDESMTTRIRSVLKLSPNQYKKFSFMSSSYGGEYIQIPAAIRHKAGVLIDMVRRLGFGISLQSRIGCWLEPFRKGMEFIPFSIALAEQCAIQEFEKILKNKTMNSNQYLEILIKPKAWYLGEDRLWSTVEGKTFAQTIQKMFPKEVKLNKPIGLIPISNFDEVEYDYPLSPPEIDHSLSVSPPGGPKSEIER